MRCSKRKDGLGVGEVPAKRLACQVQSVPQQQDKSASTHFSFLHQPTCVSVPEPSSGAMFGRMLAMRQSMEPFL
jgi:hypothetical protein